MENFVGCCVGERMPLIVVWIGRLLARVIPMKEISKNTFFEIKFSVGTFNSEHFCNI